MTTKKNYMRYFVLMGFAVMAVIAACERDAVPYGEIEQSNTDTTDNNNPTDTTDTTNPTDTIVLVDIDTVYIQPATNPCDPDSVYFERDVLPILQSNCALDNCHSTQSHEEGIIYANYEYTLVTGRINLNSPSNSTMYRVLIDNDPDDRMPPSPYSALSSAQISTILRWIQQGAKNLHCVEVAPCETENVSFASMIQPIINNKCKGCHSGTYPSGNVPLASYANVKAIADNGALVGVIMHQTPYAPMPYPLGSASLPDCEIAQIQAWVAAGAPNN